MHRALGGAVGVLVALAWAAPASADVNAAVGGVRDPASGTLELFVQASENGDAGLRTARAALAGQALASAHFADPTCAAKPAELRCPPVGAIGLKVPTTGVADGPQRLEVTIEDGAGKVVHVVDRTITVDNTPPNHKSSVTVGIGSGPLTFPPPRGPRGGNGPGESPLGCRSPRLSAELEQRPLRFRRGVAVLKRGRKYTFKGRLTCVVDGRRRSARRGTVVELRLRVRGRTVARAKLRVHSRGRITVRKRFRRSTTLSLMVRAANGRRVHIRIPVRVTSHKKRAR